MQDAIADRLARRWARRWFFFESVDFNSREAHYKNLPPDATKTREYDLSLYKEETDLAVICRHVFVVS